MFLEIPNVRDYSVRGEFAILDDQGVLLDGGDFSILPEGRVDIDIHSLVGKNKIGQLILFLTPRAIDDSTGEISLDTYLNSDTIMPRISSYVDLNGKMLQSSSERLVLQKNRLF